MNRDNQVDEMTKVIARRSKDFRNPNIAFMTTAEKTAESLYNAGYLKQREGRWKGAGMGDYYCSRCCATYSGGDVYNYCPNCGAKMKDESEGEG